MHLPPSDRWSCHSIVTVLSTIRNVRETRQHSLGRILNFFERFVIFIITGLFSGRVTQSAGSVFVCLCVRMMTFKLHGMLVQFDAVWVSSSPRLQVKVQGHRRTQQGTVQNLSVDWASWDITLLLCGLCSLLVYLMARHIVSPGDTLLFTTYAQMQIE